MGKQRQNIQLELAFVSEGRGEILRSDRKGTELSMAKRHPESPALLDLLIF